MKHTSKKIKSGHPGKVIVKKTYRGKSVNQENSEKNKINPARIREMMNRLDEMY